MKTKNDIMEEKDIDEKLKKALKDIKDGLLFSEDDGDEELEPIMFENNKSVFENKKTNDRSGVMAKDDYFRIVYIILKYLYKQMKLGNTEITLDDLLNNAGIPNVPKQYFDEIISNLIENEYIAVKGKEARYIHMPETKLIIETLKIKPKGIEYLEENSMMKKVSKLAKEIKDFI